MKTPITARAVRRGRPGRPSLLALTGAIVLTLCGAALAPARGGAALAPARGGAALAPARGDAALAPHLPVLRRYRVLWALTFEEPGLWAVLARGA
ncbi:hypothetical protein [Streptomyces sp. NPDC058695]|uniref:hypothetical protein n=1 Tax=Streptomyces sp. NPDC058695 TaxID=3346604 RepID=UPI00364CD4C9